MAIKAKVPSELLGTISSIIDSKRHPTCTNPNL